MNKFILCTDGGARGNPGPAALGAVILNEKNQILHKYGEYLGEQTNNFAEYRAVIFGLKKIKSLWGKEQAKKTEVHVRADSELLVKQMKGEYKVENPDIQKLFLELWNLKIDFAKVDFTAVPREKNKEADRMVNETLDARAKTKSLF